MPKSTIKELEEENAYLRAENKRLSEYMAAMRLQFGDPAVNTAIFNFCPRPRSRRDEEEEENSRREAIQRLIKRFAPQGRTADLERCHRRFNPEERTHDTAVDTARLEPSGLQ